MKLLNRIFTSSGRPIEKKLTSAVKEVKDAASKAKTKINSQLTADEFLKNVPREYDPTCYDYYVSRCY